MGGAGLPFGLMFLALLAIIVLLAVYVVIPWWRGEARRRERALDPAHDALVYEVPEGLDPVPIVAALRSDGLEAVEVLRNGRQRVVITCPSGREQVRPRARAVIAHEADMNLEGDPAPHREVTFADE